MGWNKLPCPHRVSLPCPSGFSPVSQSPGPIRFGFFSQGTFLLLDFALLSFWFFPSSFVCRLSNRLPVAAFWRWNGFHRSSSVLFDSPTTLRALLPFRFGLIGSLNVALSARQHGEFSWVMLNSSRSCRRHTPCCDGLNEFAFVLIVRTRPSLHLWATGSSEVSPLITARSFSSCLSDSASRRTPCPPSGLSDLPGQPASYTSFWI